VLVTNESTGATGSVEVRLLVEDTSIRILDIEPGRIPLGALRVRGWQTFPRPFRQERFAGQDAYLVKINFELTLEPDAPVPSWFEVGFEMSGSVDDNQIAVIDAVPRCVLERQEPSSYKTSGHLDLVPGDDIHLPATIPTVDLFGIGGHGLGKVG
jgi:hypothetical protein